MPITESYNAIEPWWYADIIHCAPPEGYQSGRRDGLTFFVGKFDLSTRLSSMPLLQFLARALLRPKILFIGQNTCEYCFIPLARNEQEIYSTILNLLAESHSDVALVLNMPCSAPFLSERDNARSHELLDYLEKRGFQTLGGQDIWYVPIDFSSIDEFLNRLPARHRQRLKRNLKSKQNVKVEIITGGPGAISRDLCNKLFRLACNVVDASQEQFLRFPRAWHDEFYSRWDDTVRLFLFYAGRELAGFTLGLISNNTFLFKTTGLDYTISRKHHIYFVAWFHMLEYCANNQLSFFVAGQSKDETKSYLGARATPTVHSIFFKSATLRWATRKLIENFAKSSESLPPPPPRVSSLMPSLTTG
jgi:hypothetical protein